MRPNQRENKDSQAVGQFPLLVLRLRGPRLAAIRMMRPTISAFVAAAIALAAPSVTAADIEELAREGYAVIAETRVNGEFEGCDFDKRIPLTNGLLFVCSTYSYSYSYRPEVLILKHVGNGGSKVL